MCGRFVLDATPGQIQKRFSAAGQLPEFSPHYNISPGAMVPIIRDVPEQSATLAKWGLIPVWAKDPKIGYKMINARAESLAEKPSYKRPFSRQRCLIPASGFYEWATISQTEKGSKAEKIPYYIRLTSQNIFAFAGLYDNWRDVEGKELLTFTIITTSPNPLMEKIHNRMPVILPRDKEGEWLNSQNIDISNLSKLLKPLADKEMEAYPVGRAVNSPQNDDPGLLKLEKPEIVTQTELLL